MLNTSSPAPLPRVAIDIRIADWVELPPGPKKLPPALSVIDDEARGASDHSWASIEHLLPTAVLLAANISLHKG